MTVHVPPVGGMQVNPCWPVVPGGFTPDGLPVGLQLVAAPRADRRLLEIAHAIEQATGAGRRRPVL